VGRPGCIQKGHKIGKVGGKTRRFVDRKLTTPSVASQSKLERRLVRRYICQGNVRCDRREVNIGRSPLREKKGAMPSNKKLRKEKRHKGKRLLAPYVHTKKDQNQGTIPEGGKQKILTSWNSLPRHKGLPKRAGGPIACRKKGRIRPKVKTVINVKKTN